MCVPPQVRMICICMPDTGGVLELQGNELSTLPGNFGMLSVGWNLDLSENKLRSLPELFGQLPVGGTVLLQ